MKIYRGRPEHGSAAGTVTVVDSITGQQRELDPRLDLMNHSPTGFAWGYGGSGPAQLALAIVADVTGDDRGALQLYQRFKWAEVSRWPQGEAFAITAAEVFLWIEGERHREEIAP